LTSIRVTRLLDPALVATDDNYTYLPVLWRDAHFRARTSAEIFDPGSRGSRRTAGQPGCRCSSRSIGLSAAMIARNDSEPCVEYGMCELHQRTYTKCAVFR